jgi:hypothetical protein
MTLPLKAREVDVRNAFDFDIVKGQTAFEMNCPDAVLKIGLAEIAMITV